LKLCILGSGSAGNSIYIAGDGGSFLIDAGLSRKELEGRLASVGAALSEIEAVLISHEHHDHTRGLAVLCRSHGAPVYVNRQTASVIIQKGIPAEQLRFFRNGSEFAVGGMTVHPFPVPHDASDPVGFVVCAGEMRVGIVTDCGHPSETVKRMLRGCNALVIEANHDPDLLNNGPRHVSLKERIRSDVGHLSNDTAAELLSEIVSEELSDVFLAHLSEECNSPDLALAAVERAMRETGFGHVNVRLTYADRASDLVEYQAASHGTH
jgi:phosphoribosyl 1,2-cyclic phosphodiesterase